MRIILLAIYFFSTSSFAATIVTCEVESPTPESIMITLDQNNKGTELIDYTYEKLNIGRETTTIYSRWPMIRGGSHVSYCNPNENEYRDYGDTYSIWSICQLEDGYAGHVAFDANFNIKNGGTISFLKADNSTKDLKFSDCK